MGGDDESESSDESYTIDFSYYQTMMNQSENKNNETDKNSILIDTGSTFSCINNHKLLTDIKKCKPINGISNGGTMVTGYQGELPGFFAVYYNPESLLNILSFAEVRKKYRITMDTAEKNCIVVHLSDSRKMNFEEIRSGLYVWKPSTNTNKKNVSVYSFLTLVEHNKDNFTRREVGRADAAK